MAAMHLSDEELVRRLSAHPNVRIRVESLLLAVDDEAGDLKEADAAEMLVIEQMRRMGQDALQAWAARQVDKTSKDVSQTNGTRREGKKTVLAHNVWRHHGRGAAISQGEQAPSPLRTKRQGQQLRLFAALAAGCH